MPFRHSSPMKQTRVGPGVGREEQKVNDSPHSALSRGVRCTLRRVAIAGAGHFNVDGQALRRQQPKVGAGLQAAAARAVPLAVTRHRR